MNLKVFIDRQVTLETWLLQQYSMVSYSVHNLKLFELLTLRNTAEMYFCFRFSSVALLHQLCHQFPSLLNKQ